MVRKRDEQSAGPRPPTEAHDTVRHLIMTELAQGPLSARDLSGLVGIPEKNRAGETFDDIVFDAVVSTIEGLPRARRRDPDALAESVRRAVRAVINEHWGKKPPCLVHVLTV